MRSAIQPASILVIDDYLLMRKNLHSILTLAGYQVQITSNVAEALRLLQITEISLIITDVMLPGVDGLAFYQQVRARERWRQIPFIFLSGSPSKLGQVQTQLASDGVTCLTKPFVIQDLLDAVARALLPARVG